MRAARPPRFVRSRGAVAEPRLYVPAAPRRRRREGPEPLRAGGPRPVSVLRGGGRGRLAARRPGPCAGGLMWGGLT